ncbi:substrate-binding domain-containing protein [Oscillatoria sp. CS-180]|uniref:substrate-binding domain-containing protein n=1 Tax=Oscillatoria sp. CS-180 TaxID=3021720 RepID=UPI00232B1218|nr:substrate-binding domain-containing protein [Oscillatoria sp. CS-180]MDB9525495.1 substrate-binding domain-containing protein [Oscillatoria sp. CS-180]
MVKARNRSLFVLLLTVACLAPPLMAANPQEDRLLAQVDPDNPDAVEAPTQDAVEEPAPESPAETAPQEEVLPLPETTPPELSPTFELPNELPDGTTVSITGSSSMEVITRSLIQQFQQAYPNADVTFTEQSSEAALADLQTGSAELVATGRSLTDEQLAQGLTEVDVSREKIAVIVGASNPYEGQLEADDFVRIFRGEITNWSELGGPDVPIRFIDRPETSDTRAALGDYEIFGGDLTTGENIEQAPSDSTSEIVEALGDNGISYAIASQVINQDNVRVLSMHNTLPDDPRYPYSQPRNYIYQSTETLPVGVEAFLAFATNAQGQEAVAQAKAAEAADVAAADLPDTVSVVRPDGQGFVTGDRTGNLNFWSADGTAAGDPVSAHTGPVTALAVSSDGRRLISGGADGTIRLWDSTDNAIGDPINGGNGPITSLIAQPDGSFISASADGTLQRWDEMGNTEGEPITGHEDAVRDMALTADDATLITASKDGTIRRWNVADGSATGEPLTGHQGAVQALAVKPDGTFFSGGADATVRRWDSAGTQIGEPVQVAGPVNAIAANADGTNIAVGDETGTLQLLSGEGVPVGQAITDVGAPIDDLAFTPDGQLIVSAGETPQIRDSGGQLIATPTSEAESDTEADGIESVLLDLWQRVSQQPLRFLWIIPVLVLGLLLLQLLRNFQQDEEDLDEEEAVDVPPEGRFDPVPSTESQEFGLTSPDADDEAVTGFISDDVAVPLDSSLTKAKQTLAEGISLGSAGRHQESLDRFNKAIELADMERLKAAAAGASLVGAGVVIARGLARRGTALTHLGRLEEGLKSINRALEMDANDVAAWIGKGNVLTELGQFDEAVFSFDKAIELNPNIAAAWQGKGIALQKIGRDTEARRCLAKADALGGIDDDIPMNLETPVSAPVPITQQPDNDITPTPVVPQPTPDVSPSNTDFSADSGLSDFDESDFMTSPVDFTGDDFTSADFADDDFTNSEEQAFVSSAGDRGMEADYSSDSETSPNQPRIVPDSPDEVETIGIITPQPQPPVDSDTELPSDLLAAVEDLPTYSEQEIPARSGPENDAVQAPASFSDYGQTEDTDIPAEVRETLEYLPSEPDTPDPNAPMTEPIPVPPDVEAILAGESEIPSTEETPTAINDPMAAFLGNDPTTSMRPTARPSADIENPEESPEPPSVSIPEAAVEPDPPEEMTDPALEGLPPEVIEALKGIPEDSPDSFGFSGGSSTPPPPPNNPRLRDS